MFFNSIRVTLTIWYVGVLALIIVAFSLTIDVLVSRNLNQMASMNLAGALDTVVVALRQEEADIAELRSKGPPAKDDPTFNEDDERKVTNLTMEEKIVEELKDLKLSGYFIMVLNQQGAVSISTLEDDVLQSELFHLPTATASADIQGENDSFRIQQRSLTLDDKEFRLIVARSLREQMAFINFLRRIVYCTIPVAILLAAAGGYFMACRSLAPIVSMSKQAQKISSSNLNERLQVRNESDELGGLATVFNALLERLENTFERHLRLRHSPADSASSFALLSVRDHHRVRLFDIVADSLADGASSFALLRVRNHDRIRLFDVVADSLADSAGCFALFRVRNHHRVRLFNVVADSLADRAGPLLFFNHRDFHSVGLLNVIIDGLAFSACSLTFFLNRNVDSDRSRFGSHLRNKDSLLDCFPGSAGDRSTAGRAAITIRCTTRAAARGTRCRTTSAGLPAEAATSLGRRRQGDGDCQRENQTHTFKLLLKLHKVFTNITSVT